MNVYFAIPSCRPAEQAEPILAKWRAQGYRIALLRQGELLKADVTIPTDHYLGWAASINILARFILENDPKAEWIVSGGDDTEPDLNNTAEEIAAQCREHFYNRMETMYPPNRPKWSYLIGSAAWQTFGVMQPIGDKQLWPGSYIDCFAGSPWMGREFCQRAYQGNGPLFEGYHHMFGDEELQAVATKLGVFWQRPDLVHKHMHWGRPGVSRAPIPGFLQPVNTSEHWNQSKALFEQRKAAGFPGHEPMVEACASVSH